MENTLTGNADGALPAQSMLNANADRFAIGGVMELELVSAIRHSYFD